MALSCGDSAFWEAQADAEAEAGSEWYADYEPIRLLLQRQLEHSHSVLVIGSGSLHEKLYDSGYRGLTVVDFSSGVLAAARQRSSAAGRASINFQLCDIVTGLGYQHYPYNAVIDKGTMDCILCRETGEQDARQAMQHIYNNLKSSGVYIMLTHAPPEMRLPLLTTVKWDAVQIKVLVPVDSAAGGAPAATGQEEMMVREFSAQVDAGEQASYVYICKRPF